jgi:type IV pilus secretin PilQ/predicted competence protein
MKMKLGPSLLIIALLCGSPLWPQSSLVSIKKGNRGDKSWAVMAFEQNAVWIGLSQEEEGKFSLYFLGDAGVMDGSVVTIDPEFNRSILVKQVRTQPSIIRADVACEANVPLSVLKKHDHVVIAFNDEKLLDGSQILYGEGASVPARLVSVTPAESPDRASASLQFEGRFDWTGYARYTNNTAAVFIRNSELGVAQNQFAVSGGAVQAIQLSAVEGETPGIKALLTVLPSSKFNIAIKDNALLVESPKSVQEGQNLFAQESPAPSGETAPSAAEEKSDATAQPAETTPLTAQSAPPEEKPNTAARPVETPVQNTSAEGLPPSLESPVIPWDQKVSFEFNSTPVRDALRLVAASNSLNMVISEGVKGKTTMKLENVTLKQALDKIIFTNDCDYYVDGNILTVRPMAIASKAGRITKIYRLRYADAVNVAKVVKRMATSDSLVEAFQSDFLDYAESGKARTLYKLSTIQGIRRSSVLVVTDIPEKVREIDQVIAELDKPPYQILIESKLVEIAPNSSNQLGIDWDQTLKINFKTDASTQTKESTFTNSTASVTQPFLNIDRTVQMGKLTASQYAAMIDFLKTKTNSKLMSNPRLLATDNEESSISVGKTVPVATVQRGSGGQGDMVTFDYKEISIRLNVTPHVGSNNEITMYVNPIIEEIVDWKVYGGNEAPVTDKRSVNSIVTVKNGETVVIGGLVKNQLTEITKRVWLLGSLPLIGPLFQHDSRIETQTDLMIFITPTIAPATTS